MRGEYAWLAGASASNVLADLVRWVTGGDIAGMSAACNKPASSVSGPGAGGWSAVDAGYGVVRHAGLAGGPGVTLRLSVSAAQRVQVSAVDGWDAGSHSGTHATTAFDASLLLSAAGSVNLIAGDGVLMVASSDWASWVVGAEVKRAGPALAGAASKSGALIVTSSNQHYMARVKTPSTAGDTNNAYLTLQSAYGALSAAAARDQTEHLYLPMAPATVAYSSVPVEEIEGVLMVGGYAMSGDSVLDAGGAEYVVLKAGGSGFAVLRA